MYYTEPVVIKREAIEIPTSEHRSRSVTLEAGVAIASETLALLFEKNKASLENEGFPIVRVAFQCDVDDETDNDRVRLVFRGSRLETPEELAARIERQERHNRRVAIENANKAEELERRKAIKALTEHLTTEQLKALTTLEQK